MFIAMTAMKALLVSCVVLGCISSALAQSNQPCPVVTIDAAEKVDPGTPIVFTARTNSASTTNVKYRWRVSAGTITTGENTSSVTVDTAGLAGQSITASVQIDGSETCTAVSKSVEVTAQPFICGLAFDQYGDIRFEYEKARLDNFAIQLLNQPSVRGAIAAIAGQQTYRGEAADRLRRARDYLVKVRGVLTDRLVTIDAGYEKDFSMYLHIVPEGATLPAFESRVPLSEVKFTKRRPRNRSH